MIIFGEAYHIGASLGLACRDHADLTTDNLIRHADVAMYTAKGRGKNCWELYDPDIHGQLGERRLAELPNSPA
jgi:predicted signal transduction protein with EAL and GGDEF domain